MAKTKEIFPTTTFVKYDGEIKIDFYEKYGRYSHIYIRRDNGEWLKSVTKATGILDKPALIPWACKEMEKKILEVFSEKKKITNLDIEKAKYAWSEKRDDSADKGKQIHALVNEYIKFKLGREKKEPKMPKDNQIVNGFIAFKQWEIEHQVEFVETELLVFSKKHNFVGTLDCIAIVDGEYCLIDFKSGNGIYWEMLLQVSGYAIAHEEESKIKFDACWIARFNKDTADFEVKKFKANNKLKNGFLSCLFLAKLQGEAEKIIK